MVQLSHLYMTTGKTIALTLQIFVGKVMSLLFNMLSRFFIALLPKSKHPLISWLQVTVHSDFGAQENKVYHYLHFSSSVCYEVMRLDAMILVFWMLSFKPAFSLLSFSLIKRLFISSSLSAIRGIICISEVIDIYPSNLDSSLCFSQPSISHGILCI